MVMMDIQVKLFLNENLDETPSLNIYNVD